MLEYFFTNPTRITHLRELSRQINLSPTWTAKTVKQLAKEEFLIVEKQRNQQRVIIKANRENKSFLQLKRIYNIYHLYTRGFVEYLINQYGKPECIILFGSYAKGEDVESSDIDIAIITTRNEKNLALEKYEKQTARKIKIKELIKAKIEKEFWNTLANGIILYGYLEVNS